MSAVQSNVPCTELSAEHQNLLDPDKPIPTPIIFIPMGLAGWLGPILVLAFVAPFAVGTAITIPEAWLDRLQGMPTDPVALWVGPPVFLVTAPLTVWAIRRFRQVRRSRKLHRQGRWRQGLFVLPDALLFNHGQHCTLIPRSSIVKIGPPTQEPDREPHIIYQDQSGKSYSEQLPFPEITSGIQQWLETGHYPADSSP